MRGPWLPENVRERMAGPIVARDQLQQQLKRPHPGNDQPPGCFGCLLSLPLVVPMLLLSALRGAVAFCRRHLAWEVRWTRDSSTQK